MTPEERAEELASEIWHYAEAAPPIALDAINRHIAAAVADAVAGERARLLSEIKQCMPLDMSLVHWAHVTHFKAIQQIIQQEPTQ